MYLSKSKNVNTIVSPHQEGIKGWVYKKFVHIFGFNDFMDRHYLANSFRGFIAYK